MSTPIESHADGRPPDRCDVLVVGGGINGAGIARDLAGRGLSVVLVERDDLAAHTSSASTKLIHGGLRYLEHKEFSLVRKALAEREVLLKGSPHIMRPLRFVMPHDPSMRPTWMIRAGLFLYDHLARREWLPGSETVALRRSPLGAPLQSRFTQGFVYSDGWVDDARLVLLNALDAQGRGAVVRTRCTCTGAGRMRGDDGAALWRATLQATAATAATAGADASTPAAASGTHVVQARMLVNAAGPWAASFLRDCAGIRAHRQLRLVQGSHIVVPRIFEHDHAYIFQNPDGRIIFAIPYEERYTLIGTTDVEIHGDAAAARIATAEVEYLCQQASRYFVRPVLPADVVWTYAGVRPLLDDGGDASSVTRDYLLDVDTDGGGAPLMTVWGGKITTFRKLAEQAGDEIVRRLGTGTHAWTERSPLPGGDLSAWIGPATRPDRDFERFVERLAAPLQRFDATTRRRWARAYGARVADWIPGLAPGRAEAIDPAALGAAVAPGLHEAELDYLHAHEWARSAEDVLWRRSKLGLHLDASGRAAVDAWWRARHREAAPPLRPAQMSDRGMPSN